MLDILDTFLDTMNIIKIDIVFDNAFYTSICDSTIRTTTNLHSIHNWFFSPKSEHRQMLRAYFKVLTQTNSNEAFHLNGIPIDEAHIEF